MQRTSAARPAIAALILAAGTSSRMGAQKLLLPLGDRPILAHTVAAVLASTAATVVVVLGRDAEQVAAAVPQRGITVVINPAYATGMASSLRAGVAALPAAATGALVLLGDQPLVSPALIDSVLAEASAHPDAIVAASFGGQRGHPIYFPRDRFGELSAVQGDEGGRSVLARHSASLRLLPWSDPIAGLDLDTADEYARLTALWPRHTGGVDH